MPIYYSKFFFSPCTLAKADKFGVVTFSEILVGLPTLISVEYFYISKLLCRNFFVKYSPSYVYFSVK